jgi:hypothetical protein
VDLADLWPDETACGGLLQGISLACLSKKTENIVNILVKRKFYGEKSAIFSEEKVFDGGKMAVLRLVSSVSRRKYSDSCPAFTILRA